MVEEYINDLKRDKKTVKGIAREYDKQIEHFMKNSALTSNSSYYTLVLTGIFISLGATVIGSEISIIIRLIYTMPLLISSLMTLRAFLEVKKNRYLEMKPFLKLMILSFLDIIFITIAGAYGYQYILFQDWEGINYLTSLGLLILILIPIIILSKKDSQKKFIKEFVNTNKKYKYPSKVLSGIICVGIIIINITKPYYLLLAVGYGLIILLVNSTVYFIYKYKMYDYIQSLKKE